MKKLVNEFNLSSKEEEIIILKNALDIINNAVNCRMFDFLGNPPQEAIAKTTVHSRLFLILLVDFLSGTSSILQNNKNYYEHLLDICKYNNVENIGKLKQSLSTFNNWISEKIIIKQITLKSSKDSFDITIGRQDLVQICGNICKHNITNLSWRIEKLKKIIGEAKKDVSTSDIIASLYELYDMFTTDYLDIQTTIWVELLNNIRIGILQYLKPTFNQSIVYDKDIKGKYHYEYPIYISSPLAKEFFWNLMDDVRINFFIKDFKSSEIIKRINKKQMCST